jgi:hypothetical protein
MNYSETVHCHETKTNSGTLVIINKRYQNSNQVTLCAHKVLHICDDGDPKKSTLLRKIELPATANFLRVSGHFDRHLIGVGTQEGYVIWYNVSPVKLEGRAHGIDIT